MASTPILEGTVIVLRNEDDNDPDTPIGMWFVEPGAETGVMLANSFGSESLAHFVQLASVFCQFHGLEAPVNETRYTSGELQGTQAKDYDLFNE